MFFFQLRFPIGTVKKTINQNINRTWPHLIDIHIKAVVANQWVVDQDLPYCRTETLELAVGRIVAEAQVGFESTVVTASHVVDDRGCQNAVGNDYLALMKRTYSAGPHADRFDRPFDLSVDDHPITDFERPICQDGKRTEEIPDHVFGGDSDGDAADAKSA